jgi:hypothetical protein
MEILPGWTPTATNELPAAIGTAAFSVYTCRASGAREAGVNPALPPQR